MLRASIKWIMFVSIAVDSVMVVIFLAYLVTRRPATSRL
jgi:hypothetical protein